jgi:tripartite-type tricarboxylate transporter receptor subunit TctC
LPGLYISAWQGILVPRGTPKDVIGKLNTAVVDALADSSVRQALSALQRAEIKEMVANHQGEIAPPQIEASIVT